MPTPLGRCTPLVPKKRAVQSHSQNMVVRDAAKAWIKFNGYLKSRLKTSGFILANWQTMCSGFWEHSGTIWKFFADVRTFLPLKSNTRLPTSSFHSGTCVTRWCACSPSSSARSPLPRSGHQTVWLPSGFKPGMLMPMALKMQLPTCTRVCLMEATCCLPWSAQVQRLGENRQCSHRSRTSSHSFSSLDQVMVNVGLDGLQRALSQSVGL
mmetsp:Transcript_103239/g.301130  ORF Transcript_103239/g.301130 Transcript_103239/m.301130 type:complete len:210 (+) Transcript_103239:93-722(+)